MPARPSLQPCAPALSDVDLSQLAGAIVSCHKLGVLKPHTFIFRSRYRGQEGEINVMRPKSVCPGEVPGENLCCFWWPLAFPGLRPHLSKGRTFKSPCLVTSSPVRGVLPRFSPTRTLLIGIFGLSWKSRIVFELIILQCISRDYFRFQCWRFTLESHSR